MKPGKGLILCLVALWPSFSVLGDGALAAAKAWYVSASVTQSGDGTAWGTAFKTIQEGINAALHGDTVTVAEGTYQENVQFKGKNIVLTGPNPLDPGVIARTIIQGRQLGPTVTFSGTENASCVLSGFTVWDGKAENGGAILGNGTRATIGLNVITGGTADKYGGGIHGCDGLIHLNVITINSSGIGGGGLAFCNGPIQLNVISFCWSQQGGALYECHGPVRHNTIKENWADSRGGGLHSCAGLVQNNTIMLNSTGKGGPGGGLSGCFGTIENNTICVNSAQWGGGLSYCLGFIQNNLIAGNRAYADAYGGYGGGLEKCDGMIRNNTITGNSADVEGGALFDCQGTILNCIIWGNNAPTGAQLDPVSTWPTYSCIEGWTGGVAGNTALDPKFLDADGPDNDPKTYEDNNYRLEAISPCIDKGKNEPWMWGGG